MRRLPRFPDSERRADEASCRREERQEHRIEFQTLGGVIRAVEEAGAAWPHVQIAMKLCRVVGKVSSELSLLLSCPEQNGNRSRPCLLHCSRHYKLSFLGLVRQSPQGRKRSVSGWSRRLHQVRVIGEVRHGRQCQRKLGNLSRIAVVLLESPNISCDQSCAPPRHPLTVDLLCDVAKEREASVSRMIAASERSISGEKSCPSSMTTWR